MKYLLKNGMPEISDESSKKLEKVLNEIIVYHKPITYAEYILLSASITGMIEYSMALRSVKQSTQKIEQEVIKCKKKKP